MPYKDLAKKLVHDRDPAFKERHRVWMAQWYQANKEKLRKKRAEQLAQWSAANKERIRLRKAAYQQTNREKTTATRTAYYRTYKTQQHQTAKAYREAHPEKNRLAIQQRRARKAAAPLNDLTATQWRMIKEHYGHRCVYCGRKMQRLTIDHITPLVAGGSHTLSNVVPACGSCNSKKGKRAVLKPIQPLLL